jgi:hypothetical protein
MVFNPVSQIKQHTLPHVGELVARRLDVVGMTKAEFGRRIATSRQNVNSLLRKPTLTVDQLMEISVALQYDFFAVLSEALYKAEPDCQRPPTSPATYVAGGELLGLRGDLERLVGSLELSSGLLRVTLARHPAPPPRG